jgi:hypothetical protein
MKIGSYVKYKGMKTGLDGENGFVESIHDSEGTPYETVMVKFDKGYSSPCSVKNLHPLEDPRKTGLKNGLRQLNIEQLQRVIDYPGEMVLDTYNYQDGNFCPLAIAVGLDQTMMVPSHDAVYQALTNMGYKVYNTRNIAGEYYTNNRLKDLLEAANEVLLEKQNAKQQ